jgi:hypothetical protein
MTPNEIHEHKPGMPVRSYLVTLMDHQGIQQVIVQTPCVCDIQQWATAHQVDLSMVDPVVLGTDEEAARHIPVAEPS